MTKARPRALTYAVKAAVGGKLGQIGGRMIDASARQLADQFFDALRAAPHARRQRRPQAIVPEHFIAKPRLRCIAASLASRCCGAARRSATRAVVPAGRRLPPASASGSARHCSRDPRMKAPRFDYVRRDRAPGARAAGAAWRRCPRARRRPDAAGHAQHALSEPALLVDITGVDALRGIERRGDRLWIGALATHSEIEGSPLVAEAAPLLGCRRAAHRPPRRAQCGHLGRLAGLCRSGRGMAGLPAGARRHRDRAGPAGPAPHRRARVLPRPLHDRAARPTNCWSVPTCRWRPRPTGSASTNLRGAAATTQRPASRWPRASSARRRKPVRLCFLGVGATPLRAPRTEALLAGKELTDRHDRDRAGLAQGRTRSAARPAPRGRHQAPPRHRARAPPAAGRAMPAAAR